MRGIIYQGPSAIDGAPIVAIATEGSRNAKTGDMIQTWILRQDRPPHIAAKDGADVSVCGSCPHRYDPSTGARTCYVRVGDAPLSVWRAWARGAYSDLSHKVWQSDIPIRIGSYGDPGALPFDVVRRLAEAHPTHTGYTHAWRDRPDLRPYLMASVDSAQEAKEARALGWRTYRVASIVAPYVRRADPSGPTAEIPCPSPRVECASCGLCAGASLSARSVWIAAHGAQAGRVGRSLKVLL